MRRFCWDVLSKASMLVLVTAFLASASGPATVATAAKPPEDKGALLAPNPVAGDAVGIVSNPPSAAGATNAGPADASFLAASALTASARTNLRSIREPVPPRGLVDWGSESEPGDDGSSWQTSAIEPPLPPEALVKARPNEVPFEREGDVAPAAGTDPGDRAQSSAARDAIGSLAALQLDAAPVYVMFAATVGGDDPAAQALEIVNSGPGDLSFTITESIPWLVPGATAGVVSGSSTTVDLAVSTAGLSPANSPFVGTVTVANADDPADTKDVWVRLSLVAGGPTSVFSYDENGNLQRRIDANGAVVDYTYDSLDRLTLMRYPDGRSVAYAYDANGNRTSMTDSRGVTQYQYDAKNRLTAVYHPGLNPVRYAYDDAGRITGLTYPDGRVMSYGYDLDGRLATVADASGTTTYTYHAASGLLAQKILPNGVSTTYAYDDAGRLTDLSTTLPSGPHESYHFDLDPNGNRTRITRITPAGVEETTYAYDALDRLTEVEYPDGRSVAYAYDALGNRTAMTTTVGSETTVVAYTYDDAQRLLRAGDEVFQHDANGNIIRRATAERTVEYEYDADNRLIRVDDGSRVVAFEYDGDGNRTAKIVDGVRANYINDVSSRLTQVLSEADENWDTRRAFTYGLDRVAIDEVGGDRQYFLYNSPFRGVSGLVDAAAEPTAGYAYDAFGAPTTATAGPPNPFRYDGEQYDAETGLIFLRARYYDPGLGRFMSGDPVAGSAMSTQTLNPYVYVANNPVNRIDPGGDVALLDTAIGAGIGLVVGGVTTYAGDVIGGVRDGRGLGSLVPTSGWETYVGNALGGAASGAAVTLNPLAAGAIGGSVASTTTQLLQKKGSFDVGAVASEAIFQAIGGKLAAGLIARGPGRPATEAMALAFGKISQNVNWKRGIVGDLVGDGVQWATTSVYGRIVSPGGDPGGVALNKTADLMLDIDDIDGATYDPATGQVVFFGRNDVALPPMDLDDTAVAVKSVNAGADPGVSIDPPIVDNQFSVRYEGATEWTEFGWVMFESDRILKGLTLGKDNITGQPVTSNVPGYLNMQQRELASGDCAGGASWSDRFWLQPKEVRLVESGDGNAMVFDAVAMEVKTEFTLSGGSPGQQVNPEAEAFAAHFTAHYDAFAAEFPILKDLARLGKIVAVVKWIKDNNIPLDVSFLESYVVEFYNTPTRTPAITVVASQGNCTITSTGGVTYQPPNEYLPDDPDEPAAGGLAGIALGSRPAETDFAWDFTAPASLLRSRAGQGDSAREAAQEDTEYTAVSQSLARRRKDGNIKLTQTDLSFPVADGLTLDLVRYYDSFWEKSSGFGPGWSALPLELRFPTYRRNVTFGGDPTPYAIYARINVVNRPEGREDPFVLLGRDSENRPLYARADGADLLWEQADGTFVLSEKDHDTRRFDAEGRLIRIEDANGNHVDLTFSGERLTEIEGGDRAIQITYDGQGRIVRATGPGGRRIDYGYDVSGRLTSVTDVPAGTTITFAYDADGLLAEATDANGNPLIRQSFDAYGRAVDQVVGQAAGYDVDYDLSERRTITTDPAGRAITETFDASYRLLTSTNPLGQATALTYAGPAGPASATDAAGATTGFEYDVRGNLTAVVDAEGLRTDFYYDASSHRVAMRDARGVATGFWYDSRGNLTRIYDNVTLNFDANGVLTSFSWNANRVTELTYDDAGNLVAVRDPEGDTRALDYDDHGMITAVTETLGVETQYAYDALSRLVGVSRGGHELAIGYDAAGRPAQVETAAGAVEIAYDPAGNVTSVTDARGGDTTLDYDPDGALARVEDAAGGTVDFARDVLGNMTGAELPGGAAYGYEYDELNRLVRVTAAAGAAAAPKIALAADAHDFGWVQVARTARVAVRIFNQGRAELVVDEITSSNGAFAALFTGPVSILPGAFATFDVTYTPGDLGGDVATLEVLSNDAAAGPTTLTVRGEGVRLVEGLRAAPGGGIRLTWTALPNPDGDFHHFNVYRSEAPIDGDVTDLTSLDASIQNPAATSFVDSSAVDGHIYFYAVTAARAGGVEDKRVWPSDGVMAYAGLERLGGAHGVATAPRDETAPAVAFNPAANQYLAVYEVDRNGDGSDADVYAQRMTAGGARIGAPVAVSAVAGRNERRPRVVYNGRADQYLVVYDFDFSGTGADLDVRAQRLTGAGAMIGGVIVVSDVTAHHERTPDVAYNPRANEYLVVFEYDLWGDGTDYETYGQRIAADGTGIGNRFAAAGFTKHEFRPTVAYNAAADEYLTVFEFDLYGNGSDFILLGHRISAAGQRVGSFVIVSNYNVHSLRPRLSYHASLDEYLVVFEMDYAPLGFADVDVNGMRLSGAGQQVGGLLSYATSGFQERRPQLAYHALANEYLVVWDDDVDGGAPDLDVRGRRVAVDGSALGAAFPIAAGVMAEQRPAIVYNGRVNDYFVVHESSEGAGGADVQVRGQRIGSIGYHTPGNCNDDKRVDAGDMAALSLEVFDHDGTRAVDAGGGSFAGAPNGCDANADTFIDAGDFTCAVLTIFGGPGVCGG